MLVSVRLEIVLMLTQVSCTVYAMRTIRPEIFLDAPEWYSLVTRLKWKLVLSLFGDSANHDPRYVHGLCQMYHRLRNHFSMQTMELLGDGVMWDLVSVHLETVFVSVKDSCMVCAKRTIGSEIVLDAPIGTAR